ncbi:MAG: hypothetical protein KatS3mg024_2344 [Armatimonadota bacterium]|nr:MAG: hypothetical protein KatS3mg024_2344 [Armatimonadota bacterium]
MSEEATVARGSGFVFDPASVLRSAISPEEQARGIIAEAQQEADRLVREAQSSTESVRRAAWEEGFAEGFRQAALQWKQALEDAQRERDSVVQQLEELSAGIEQECLKLALQIAEKIVRHEIETHPETVKDILALALRQLKDRANVRILVNRADLELVRAAREDIARWAEGLRNVEIVEEPRVERGGVIVESSDGILDARPSVQMDELKRKLEEADSL